ncbi:hypothetical protein BSL78_24733 [Apostichopus japonicus]|uniref:Fucosyltransferase N-terminal domain-containing protein n=1 Tax=Stichopus japonicus TaxID=307972 RepID=A0A2G8JRY0_STIJA|nr:hypothetical protein BSL78_24733 [Apostichopus japonicus]
MTYLATIGRRYVNIFEYITFDQQPNVLINLKHIVSDRKYQNRSTKEIGVLGTEAIGKWFGDFTCFSSGEPVRVIQSPDYRRLSNCEALFLVAGQIIPWTTLIRNRPHGQIWIFMSFESPSNTNYNYDVILSHINWTFTYLSDATFPSPYGAYYLTSQTAQIRVRT